MDIKERMRNRTAAIKRALVISGITSTNISDDEIRDFIEALRDRGFQIHSILEKERLMRKLPPFIKD